MKNVLRTRARRATTSGEVEAKAVGWTGRADIVTREEKPMLEIALKLERAKRPLDADTITWLLTGEQDSHFQLAARVVQTLNEQGDEQLLDHAFSVIDVEHEPVYAWQLISLGPPDSQMPRLVAALDHDTLNSIFNQVASHSNVEHRNVRQRILTFCSRAQFESAAEAVTDSETALAIARDMVDTWDIGTDRIDKLADNGVLISALRDIDPVWYVSLSGLSTISGRPAPMLAAMEVAAGLLDENQRARVAGVLERYSGQAERDQTISQLVRGEDQSDRLATMSPAELAVALTQPSERYNNLAAFLSEQGPDYTGALFEALLHASPEWNYEIGPLCATLWLLDNTPFRAALLRRMTGKPQGGRGYHWVMSRVKLTDTDLEQLPIPDVNRLMYLGAKPHSESLYQHVDGTLGGDMDELIALLPDWQGTLPELLAAITTARS